MVKPPPAGVAGELKDGVAEPNGCCCGVPKDSWGAPNEGVEGAGAPKLGWPPPAPPKLNEGLAGVDGAPKTLLFDVPDVAARKDRKDKKEVW